MVFNFAWFGCWYNPKTFYWLFYFVKWLFSRLHGFFSTLIKTTYFAIHLLCHPSNFYKISQWCTTDREKKFKIKKKLVSDARSMKHEARSTKHEAWSMKHEARSTKHEAWSTKHEARSTKHEARSMKHEAWSTKHDGENLQITNPRYINPSLLALNHS